MEIIATHSFRGGSGKSFIALNMAVASARAGIKTIVMDCDFSSPSFQSNLTPKIPPIKYGNDFLLNKSNEKEIIYPTVISNLDAIYANPKPVLGKGLLVTTEKPHWTALQQFSQLRESLEKLGYEKLFLDTAPELSFSSVSALTVADSIILVHRPTIHSLDITLYVIQTIYTALKKTLKPRFFFLIYNQVPHGSSEKVNNLLDSLTSKFKQYIDIKILGSIPLDPEMDFWDTLLIHEDSELFKKIRNMVEKLS